MAKGQKNAISPQKPKSPSKGSGKKKLAAFKSTKVIKKKPMKKPTTAIDASPPAQKQLLRGATSAAKKQPELTDNAQGKKKRKRALKAELMTDSNIADEAEPVGAAVTDDEASADAAASGAQQPEFMTLPADSDDESSAAEASGVAGPSAEDAMKLLNAKKGPQLKKALAKRQPQEDHEEDSNCGVIYLGHLPHGFYEDQLRGFFSQFGDVLRLKVPRSSKTGRAKGYAFIEFKHEEVAQIVAETMDKYLMFSKLLVCKVIPSDQVHAGMFRGSTRKFRVVNWAAAAASRHNAPRDAAAAQKLQQRLLKREGSKRKKLAQLGIEYDFPGYEATATKPSKHTRF